MDGSTCRTKAGKTYKKTGSSAKVLSASVKPLEQRPPVRGKPSSNCPQGMSSCGAGKCAASLLGADGCALFASLSATASC